MWATKAGVSERATRALEHARSLTHTHVHTHSRTHTYTQTHRHTDTQTQTHNTCVHARTHTHARTPVIGTRTPFDTAQYTLLRYHWTLVPIAPLHLHRPGCNATHTHRGQLTPCSATHAPVRCTNALRCGTAET
jgi:hypothetical protein